MPLLLSRDVPALPSLVSRVGLADGFDDARSQLDRVARLDALHRLPVDVGNTAHKHCVDAAKVGAFEPFAQLGHVIEVNIIWIDGVFSHGTLPYMGHGKSWLGDVVSRHVALPDYDAYPIPGARTVMAATTGPAESAATDG